MEKYVKRASNSMFTKIIKQQCTKTQTVADQEYAVKEELMQAQRIAYHKVRPLEE